MAPVLQVTDLEIRYHTRDGILTAIHDASFEINAGEIVGVVGESGCGKSTLGAAMLRLLPPNGEITAGRIVLQGRDLRQLDEEALRRLRGAEISMIFQDPMTSLNPVFSIHTQMVDVLKAHRSEGHADGSALQKSAVEMLRRVGIADAARQIQAYPHQFSGGMRQRIMIAMALLSRPSVLVADEPTSALDVTLEAQIVDLIRDLREELGTAILYITHDLGVVAQLCDRVIVMYAGRIVESGDVYSVFGKPKHPYTRALLQSHPTLGEVRARLRTIAGRVPSLKDLPLGCKFAPRCEVARELCQSIEPAYVPVGQQLVLCHAYRPMPDEIEAAAAISYVTAEAAEAPNIPAAEAPNKVVIATKALRTHFPDPIALLSHILGQPRTGVRAVDGVDIQVCRGESLALVGESGSGKTTLGRTILRLENPTAGEIIVEGHDITQWSQAQIRPMRARMQMIFQDPCSSLSPRMKVSALLQEPYAIHLISAASRKSVDELLEMVGLSVEQADKYPHQLSGGQARRVGIARALALKPDILVADEPTAGLDVSVAAGILNLLKDLHEKFNLTLVIITHNLNVVSFIADRVAVMYLGKVVELAETRDLFARPQHPYTEALMSAIPVPDPRLRNKQLRIVLKGEIPSPRNPPPGCPFHPRCRYAEARCAQEVPVLRERNGATHLTACHYPERVGTTRA